MLDLHAAGSKSCRLAKLGRYSALADCAAPYTQGNLEYVRKSFQMTVQDGSITYARNLPHISKRSAHL